MSEALRLPQQPRAAASPVTAGAASGFPRREPAVTAAPLGPRDPARAGCHRPASAGSGARPCGCFSFPALPRFPPRNKSRSAPWESFCRCPTVILAGTNARGPASLSPAVFAAARSLLAPWCGQNPRCRCLTARPSAFRGWCCCCPTSAPSPLWADCVVSLSIPFPGCFRPPCCGALGHSGGTQHSSFGVGLGVLSGWDRSA